jgi:MFS family permease
LILEKPSEIGSGNARWFVVAGAFMGMICFSASRHMYPYVLPEMAKGLDLPNERMGNISSAYFVAYMLCSLLWGILADRLGPRRVMLTGIALIGAGLIAMGSAPSFLFALLFNMICGAGASALSVPQVPLLSRWFPSGGRGLAIGMAMSGNGFATFTFGLWIPLVIQAAGWRWAWWASAILVAAMFVICFVLLREKSAGSGVFPASTASAQHRPTPSVGRPPTMWDVLRQRTAWNLIAIYSIWGAGYTVFMTFGVAYLRELNWDPASASRAFALWGIFTLFGSTAWGTLADRFLKKWVLAVALVLQAAGYITFLAVGATGVLESIARPFGWEAMTIGAIGAFVGAATVGFGQIGVPAILSAATGDYFSHRIAGMGFGLLTLTFAFGCIIGPSLGGYISDATGTLRTGLLFGLGALVVSLLATLMLEKPRPARVAEEEK